MNRDFIEMLAALSEARAEYLVVGAYAVAVHGRPRATGDLDIWVNPTADNSSRVWSALLAFGAPLQDLSQQDLAMPEVVFQIGLPPARIDILTSISGVTFADAWKDRIAVRYEHLDVPVLGRASLIRNKEAVGRPRDLADLAELRQEDRPHPRR